MPTSDFQVRFEPSMREDLLRRLAATRWSDAVIDDWSYGTSPTFLRALVDYWQENYDFAAAEARLNALPQFRTEIDGFGLHYLHLKGKGPNPTPLLLMNGWPSSFAEYQKLAPMLADPAAFGGSAADAFDVVMPALPGFGFSDRPQRPDQVRADALFHRLMTETLGYSGYIAAGTDIGSGVATRLGFGYPDAVRGIHISTVADPVLADDAPPLSDAEEAYRQNVAQWNADEGGYMHLQNTRPQTPAFALADSPVGLASWIVEKFYAWSDHDGDLLSAFSFELLIDTLMIYWVTETIGSSMRSYRERRKFLPPFKPGDRVRVPTAVCVWPKELVRAPRAWAERFYDVRQFTTPARGGHFPGWEAPEAYAADLQQFLRMLNGRNGTKPG